MTTNSEAAEKMFSEGYNCAQSVLVCCGGKFGLSRETAIKVAQAFGGGMGRTGNICGAVIGALMVIGLKHSIKNAKDSSARQEAYRLTQEFFARFRSHNSSIVCRDLLGCDLGADEGMKQAEEKGLFKTICPKLVRDAAEIIDDLLETPKMKNN